MEDLQGEKSNKKVYLLMSRIVVKNDAYFSIISKGINDINLTH